MMDTSNSFQDRARSASDRVAGTIERSTDNPVGHIAHGISESNEQHDAREPMNSTMRALLLAGAGMAIAASMVMQVTGRKHESLFVGMWAPTLISVALWYQIVKGQQGHVAAH